MKTIKGVQNTLSASAWIWLAFAFYCAGWSFFTGEEVNVTMLAAGIVASSANLAAARVVSAIAIASADKSVTIDGVRISMAAKGQS